MHQLIGRTLWAGLLLGHFAYCHGQTPASAAPVTFPGESLFNDQPAFLAGVAVDRPDGVYREGDKLRVQFLAETESHLYLMYHQADGSSLLLFPNEANPHSKVAARKPVVIPKPGEEFRFRVRPPLGREVLQVLAIKEPAAELEALVAKQGRAPVIEAERLTTLIKRLTSDRSSWAEHRVPITTMSTDSERSAPTPARVGLFIGIGRYQHPEFAATHDELRHSADVMHELMLKHGKLDPARTRLLRDAEATKAKLQESISQWLPSVSRPGDAVFIYFSGHAGQLDTNDPAETDGKDEAIGPYDLEGSRPGESYSQSLARFRATNITDDTLAAWLTRLQGRQVTLILDTCASGGVADAKKLGKSFFVEQSVRTKDITQVNTLVLASCAADEQSLFEGTINRTMWFTYCLTEAIGQAAGKRSLSVQEAFAYSRKRMRTLLEQGNAPREQEPTMSDRILLPIVLVP